MNQHQQRQQAYMSQHGRGLIRPLDGLVHAVREHLIGADTALCGAGPIATHLVGDFAAGDDDACPRCRAATEGG